MRALLGRVLIAARNWIWEWRKAYKGDAFEHERQEYLCGDVYLPLPEITMRLTAKGYELNELAQYEDMGQVLSGHLYYGDRQVHVRFFFDGPQLPQFPGTAAAYEMRAHDEYSWKVHPVKHVLGLDVKNACPRLEAIYSDVLVKPEEAG
jgi:hypothetical protein